MTAPLLQPPRLRPGDPVALIAPAGPVVEERLQPGLDLLSKRYDLRWSRRIFDKSGYLAGDDTARRNELFVALADPAVKAIICARGGYGVMRILPQLDAMLLRRQPKILVGFSDITALHAWAGLAGVRSVHGPVGTQLGVLPEEDRQAMWALLEGECGAPITGLRSIAAAGTAEGPLVGGNLEMVRSLLATPYAPNFDGAVLLLEEIGERPYRVDRSLTQLALAGVLDRLSAVVIGDLVRCEEADGSGPSAEEVVRERLSSLPVPVLCGLPVGHGARNHALGLGVRVRVDAAQGRLEPLEAVTA